MNIRTAAEHLALGNRITSLFIELPVAEPDPLRRYRDVCGETRWAKAGRQAAAGRTLVELAGLAPPVVHAVLARSLFAARLFNVTVTNVPGPQHTLYALGSPLRSVVPLVPLAAEHTAGLAALSYDGDVCFCVHADRDLVPDVEEVTAGIGEDLAALRASADMSRLIRKPPAGRRRSPS